MKFKEEFSYDQRVNESTKVINKYPERIPVICEKLSKSNSNTPNIDKKKYLVPKDLTLGQFIYIIRKRIGIDPAQGLFLFANGIIPSTSMNMSEIYFLHKDSDGFLYLKYSCENVFGHLRKL